MIEIKLYLYDSSQELNGYRGTNLSQYVGQGFSNVEDITQELDTSEIVLFGYSQQKEFDPETKFIIDIVQDDEIIETLHRIVQKDLVNQPELVDDTYFNHHITFLEPSAIAQKRLVDNISATYKLKDVTLEEELAYDLDEDATMANTQSVYVPSQNFGYREESTNIGGVKRLKTWGKYFEYEGEIEMQTVSGTSTGKVYRDIEDFDVGNDNYQAKFKIPKLAIYGGKINDNTFIKMGYASLDYLIEEFSLTDNYNPLQYWEGSIISNSNLGNQDNVWVYRPHSQEHENVYKSEWLDETHDDTNYNYYKIRKYTDISAATPTYETVTIPIQKDKQYKVTISLHTFSDNVPNNSLAKKYTGNPNLWAQYDYYTYMSHFSHTTTTTSSTPTQTQMITQFITYSVDTKRLVLSSSVPYSALNLLQKAVINSSLYEKLPNIYIGDINNNDVPFYVDPAFVDELMATKIIENFYNQKNLWEILVEVGNYIHAIPEIVFGANDRLMITFNRLGVTDQSENKSQKITIMNSKGIEDYVSACSSYVTNMVQLGGTIEEWVAPKTTNDTFLVSNDTAEIVSSKSIIELLEIKVKCNVSTYQGIGISQNAIADMTEFVYEENVYKTLDLRANIVPNRGIAMYYSLGGNKITGGNYQLPQANTNLYTDYAFKKIIYCAFSGLYPVYPAWETPPVDGAWKNIKLNDFSFFIKYRTKDSVRQNHTRPDLRKYLLTSYFDNVPQHNQFNNQQDVVVDSIKFGNNMYGKLIRTGNSNYKVVEWDDAYSNIKHKGELYNINGELYYVAKANHIFYSNHIISEIEYSKDYNQLSPIIGIPSEPRFYEISEQSLIRRERPIDDYLLITDNYYEENESVDRIDTDATYVSDYTHLKNLLFTDGTTFSKYAITTYKGDKDVNQYEQSVGEPNFYIDILTPINAYSSENTLTYEWDTIDNFSAGDKIISVETPTQITDTTAYQSLRAVQYTDIYGKAALFDFYILGDIETQGHSQLTQEEIQSLPESPFTTRQDELSKIYVGDIEVLAGNVKVPDTDYNNRGLGLLKDCREALSFNYNLQAITTSDTFVLSPFFYLPNKKNVKLVFLSEEVNKLTNGYIDTSKIIDIQTQNNVSMGQEFNLQFIPTVGVNDWGKTVIKKFAIDLSGFENANDGHFTENTNYERIKAIAIICNVSLDVGDPNSQAPITQEKTQFILARNIPSNWNKERILANWEFGAPNKLAIFKNRQ